MRERIELRSHRHAGLHEPLDEHIAMREAAQVAAEEVDADGWVDPVPRLDKKLRPLPLVPDGPIAIVAHPNGPNQDSMSLRIARLDLDRALQQGLRLFVLPLVNPVDQAKRADDVTSSIDTLGRWARRSNGFFLVEVRRATRKQHD